MKKIIIITTLLIIVSVVWVLYLEQKNEHFRNSLPSPHTQKTDSTDAFPENHIEGSPKVSNFREQTAQDIETFEENRSKDVSTASITDPEENLGTGSAPENPDWADEEAHSSTSAQNQDPWKRMNSKKDSVVDGYHADLNTLIKQFGDTLEVRTAHTYMQKLVEGQERTIEEEISGMEVLKILYPELHTPAHESLLQFLKQTHAAGGTITFISESNYEKLLNSSPK